jgi:hypothetical protein
MKQLTGFICLLALASCTKSTIKVNDPQTDLVHFESTIQEIISTNCFSCHGVNSTVPMNDYNAVVLLAQSGQLKGALLSDSNTNPDAMYLHMPPFNELDPLSKSLLITWINQDCPQ